MMATVVTADWCGGLVAKEDERPLRRPISELISPEVLGDMLLRPAIHSSNYLHDALE